MKSGEYKNIWLKLIINSPKNSDSFERTKLENILYIVSTFLKLGSTDLSNEFHILLSILQSSWVYDFLYYKPTSKN